MGHRGNLDRLLCPRSSWAGPVGNDVFPQGRAALGACRGGSPYRALHSAVGLEAALRLSFGWVTHLWVSQVRFLPRLVSLLYESPAARVMTVLLPISMLILRSSPECA